MSSAFPHSKSYHFSFIKYSATLLRMQLPLNSNACKVLVVLAENKVQFPLKQAHLQCRTCYQLQKQLLC